MPAVVVVNQPNVSLFSGSTQIGVPGNPLSIAGYGGIFTASFANVVSTGNSTTTTLGANAAFTGSAEEVKDFATISVFAFSDKSSATNGLQIQWSTNSTNWDDDDTFTLPANDGKFFTFGPEARYFRILYANGSDAQSSFRLQTIYHYINTKPSSHRVAANISDDDDSELVKAVITGKDNVGGSYVNLSVTSDGFLRVVEAVSDIDSIFIVPLLSGTSSTSLLVDGSSNPKIFQVTASLTKDKYLEEIRFIANAADIQFDGAAFMKINNTLVSGVLLQIQASGTLSNVYNFRQSEDFLVFGGNDILDQTDTSDLLVASLKLNGTTILYSGSSDFVKVTVRDNLINAGNLYFKCYVRGFEK